MKEIVQNIITRFVDHADSVKVSEDNGSIGAIHIKLEVHPDDVGKVIGKQGKNISALRTLMTAIAAKEKKRKINLELIER